MTLNKNIQDILYFKGIIDFNKDYVKLDITDKKIIKVIGMLYYQF